jgi:hypothetical protein
MKNDKLDKAIKQDKGATNQNIINIIKAYGIMD